MDGIIIFSNKKIRYTTLFVKVAYYGYDNTIIGSPKISFFYDIKTNEISNIIMYWYNDVEEYRDFESKVKEMQNIPHNIMKEFKDVLLKIIEDRNKKIKKIPEGYMELNIKTINKKILNTIHYLHKFQKTIYNYAKVSNNINIDINETKYNIKLYKYDIPEDIIKEFNYIKKKIEELDLPWCHIL